MSRKTTAAEEWKSYGTVVLASFVGFSFLSIMTGSLSMFIQPIGAEFGWSRTLVSSGFTVSAIFTALLSPFFGILVDRYGSRVVALPGIIATSFCIASFSLANGSPFQWLALWAIYAIISITVKTTVWTTAVAGVFNRSQGLAIGITLCGTAAAQVILPPLADWLISDFGWRMAYVWLGFGWGGVTLLLCWLFLYGAHERNAAQARAAISAGSTTKAERPDLPGLTLAEAWRSTALWRIAISAFMIMLVTLGLMIHQIPILNEAGISRTEAAFLASLAGVTSIAGKLVTGVLLDRFRANWVGGLTLGATSLAFALLIDGVSSPALIIFAMLVNGYTMGCKLQVATYLTARYSGMRNFGKVYGFMNSVIAFGTGAGPVLAGYAYDTSGGYAPFLIAGAIGSVISGLLIFSLPPYPEWDDGDEKILAPPILSRR